ncbi:MAG TPA: hypothetical protein DET40_00130 [Lentisphaeria bacterium]|nr:MAG: hypothetical protein A2X45_00770 [Lentisphaerae bacterium GWF2_50_93]HCE41939.1 hypothetical protein [Lentisphaeria bacterium]
MELHLQYLTDHTGAKTAVQIPFSEWNNLISEYKHARQMSGLKKQFSDAFSQVKKIESHKTKHVTLGKFLNDL